MFSLKEILEATQGILIRSSLVSYSFLIKGVSTDSRTIKPEELFIALRGRRFDGHDFVNEAIEKNASLIMVSQRNRFFKKGPPMIFVKDTTRALGGIARFHRDRFKIPVIAVTGSVGKTTTKELIAQTLSCRYKVLKNMATENNHIGVPSTLLKLNSSHHLAVVELGSNRFGDIRWLTHIAHPTIGVLTNIGESHLKFLKDLNGVFKEKSEIIKHLPASGTVMINADDPYLRKILRAKKRFNMVTYGIKESADYQASSITVKDTRIEFQLNGRHSFSLNTPAAHNIYNALAAVACGRHFKISYAQIKKEINQASFPAGRQEIRRTNGLWVIDDTYNANPVSMRSAIETLSRFDTLGRKILVCADMLELGRKAPAHHASIGKLLAHSKVNALLTWGRFSRFMAQTARKENPTLEAHHCSTREELHQTLKRYCGSQDVVLVKGSRAMQMEKTVAFLREFF